MQSSAGILKTTAEMNDRRGQRRFHAAARDRPAGLASAPLPSAPSRTCGRPGEAPAGQPRASLPRAPPSPHRASTAAAPGASSHSWPRARTARRPAVELAPRLPALAPASPGSHHHIVDDQVRRGHGPGALLLPWAAAFAASGSATAAHIPLGRRSRRHCRHVKRPQPALLARRRACTSAPTGFCEGAERRRGRGTGRSRDSAHGGRHLG